MGTAQGKEVCSKPVNHTCKWQIQRIKKCRTLEKI